MKDGRTLRSAAARENSCYETPMFRGALEARGPHAGLLSLLPTAARWECVKKPEPDPVTGRDPTGTNWNMSNSDKIKGKWERSEAGTENLWHLHPWQHSQAHWARPRATPYLTGPASSRGLGWRAPEVLSYHNYSSATADTVRTLLSIMRYSAYRHNAPDSGSCCPSILHEG